MSIEAFIKKIVNKIESYLNYRKSLKKEVRNVVDVISLFIIMMVSFILLFLFMRLIGFIAGKDDTSTPVKIEVEKDEKSSWVDDVKDLFKSKSEYNEEEFAKISEECKNYSLEMDFINAHKSLNKLSKYSDSFTFQVRYEEVFDYVFNAESLFLCSKGDIEGIDRLIYLLSSIPVKGVALPEDVKYDSEYTDGFREHNNYIQYARRFNQKCDVLIDLSIANHNYYIAERVLPLYKRVPDQLKSNTILKYNNDNQETARKKINTAIQNGVFSNVTQEIN